MLCAYHRAAHAHSGDAEDLADDELAAVDISEVVGPYAWGAIHHAVESFPCQECADEGGSLMRGVHDVVNAKLGKPIEHPEDLRRLAELATSAASGHLAQNELGTPLPPELSEAIAVAMAGSDHHEHGGVALSCSCMIVDVADAADSDKPVCTGGEKERLERCVMELKDDSDVRDPFAVCTASLGCKLS